LHKSKLYLFAAIIKGVYYELFKALILALFFINILAKYRFLKKLENANIANYHKNLNLYLFYPK